jgi:hypothetical protein
MAYGSVLIPYCEHWRFIQGWRTPAITPDVPFSAAARVATVVVLARHSVLGRRREIAEYALVVGALRGQFRERSVRPVAAAGCPRSAHPCRV